MRILHTSDWHIGRRFERESLEADQRAFLEWLAGLVEARAVDLVVVAGDVYDRSLPAEDAVALLDEGLERLRAGGATVAMIPGNHDSARRLGFGARRQALGGVHVFADELSAPEPWLFEAGGEAVVVVAVPFLDPLTVPLPGGADPGVPRTHEGLLGAFLDAGRDALSAYGGVPSLAVLHANVAGGEPSASEKVLTVGGADAVAASVLGGFDYVALGHLHRPQRVGGDDRVAYSGSPLPYSFSEHHPKSVRLLEVRDGAVSCVEVVEVPVGRPVVTLEGELEALLADPAYERYVEHWVAASLTDKTAQVQPLERLRSRFPHAVSVRYAGAGAGAGVGRLGACGQPGAASPRQVEDVVLAFLAEVRRCEPEPWARELVGHAVGAAERGSAP